MVSTMHGTYSPFVLLKSPFLPRFYILLFLCYYVLVMRWLFAFVANKAVKFSKNIGLSLRKRPFLGGGLASGKIRTGELRAGGQMAKIFLPTSPSQCKSALVRLHSVIHSSFI
jgi:hypothetical protein